LVFAGEGDGVDVFTSVKLPLGPLCVISSFHPENQLADPARPEARVIV
jgi:hypothetical protein